MRRLWSHIIIAATSLLMVGATFATVVTNINSNIEFEKGRELVFRVVNKDADGNPDKTLPLDEVGKEGNAVKQTAAIMEKRLSTANITSYKVETQGTDTIKVTFVQDTDTQYNIIQNYLSFNATLALSNSKETYALATEFLNPKKKAYLETTDGYPAVVIPIDKDNELFQAVYTEAKEMSDNNTGEVEEEHNHEDGEEEEAEPTRHAYLYLWYDYVEDYYSYDKINQNSHDTYDETIAKKILMTFDAANPFLNDDQDALRAYVAPEGASEGETVSAASLKEAYQNARYYVNLLNAGQMEYHVDFLFSRRASYAVESLLDYDTIDGHEIIKWSRTFIATLCAILVVSLLLVYFYRLGASSVAVTSIVSVFMGLLFIVLLGAEYNIAGMVGLIALGLASVISGVIYLNKLKEECYRGRTLKKANSEAAKKALLPTVDVHVVLVVLGVFCYIFGGAIMKSFAVATVLGGLVSLVLNLLGLRGLMWLVTNEQAFAGRYDLFDVSNEQVSNALEEDKPKYEGANANRDFTKSKKPVAIVSLVLLVASIATLLVVGIIKNGAVYNTTSPYSNSQVYVEYSSDTDNNTALASDIRNKITTILDNSTLDGAKLSSMVEVEDYKYTAIYDSTKSGTNTVYQAYYRLTFNRVVDEKAEITYKTDTVEYKATAIEFFTYDNFVDAAHGGIDFGNGTVISFKDSVRVNADKPAFGPIILATGVALAVSAFYLLLRYRLSRGLAVLAISALATGITAGLFSMLYFLPVTSYASLAVPFVTLFVFAIGIIFMNKEREMVLEDRSKDNSVEARKALMVKATALASTPITIAFIMALYLGVNFFGFMPNGVHWIFLAVILGVCIATGLTLVLFGPCAQLFFKWFSGIQFKAPKIKKKKARPVRVKKSAEPEEAIFIGIND